MTFCLLLFFRPFMTTAVERALNIGQLSGRIGVCLVGGFYWLVGHGLVGGSWESCLRNSSACTDRPAVTLYGGLEVQIQPLGH